MASERDIEDYDQVLVVEGYSDLLFYAEMLEDLVALGRVFIKELGGSVTKAKLETLLSPGFLNSKSAIAFIFDADAEPEATRNRLQTQLTAITGQQVIDGRWTGGKLDVGLFIVPGQNLPGEIETLIWNSWAKDEANVGRKQCIESYVACMEAAGATAQSPAKGLLGALLAVRNDEDPRLGPGTRRNVFNLERPELQTLRDFLGGFV